jgi:hypothetical protein
MTRDPRANVAEDRRSSDALRGNASHARCAAIGDPIARIEATKSTAVNNNTSTFYSKFLPLLKLSNRTEDSSILDGECGPDQFRCRSGQCLPLSYRCNGLAECSDSSDESDCSIYYKTFFSSTLSFLLFVVLVQSFVSCWSHFVAILWVVLSLVWVYEKGYSQISVWTRSNSITANSGCVVHSFYQVISGVISCVV